MTPGGQCRLEQSAPEELQSMEETHAHTVHGLSPCGRDLMLEQEKSVRSPPPEEGIAETTHDE